MLRPFSVKGILSFLVGQLGLDNGEELVSHLQENWDRPFLQVEIQDVYLTSTRVLWLAVVRPNGVTGRILVLSSRGPLFLGLVLLRSVFDKFIDVHVEFEELLSYEVLDELVVVHQLLVVNLGAAFQLHLLGVVLPLDLDLHKSEADEPEHFMRVALELHTDVEGSLLHLLLNEDLLVAVAAEGILGVLVLGKGLELLVVPPEPVVLGRLHFVFTHEVVKLGALQVGVASAVVVVEVGHLVLVIAQEPLLNLIEPLQVGRAQHQLTLGSVLLFFFFALVLQFFLVIQDFEDRGELAFLALDLEAVILQLIVLHEFVGPAVVGVAFVLDVLAYLFRRLLDVEV
mmetsp:Transcript_31428/g.48038  ORF Transcript_31428/g.48038 Transcript_31428/m.48038 type:complete len:342 (-) Transcript_31428:895-1920(-)|eukprot:CAMPEP_0170488542 /NCGR_PEP_ID=MMETSP0208-20121228/7077_1 /TAXON_ID=197538 /ORGANISM="Strombidium inclinatum, Strain S3" /LENGTH=341 /DNA_ID=CAMNT_0010763155 /DNA_START=206 /DNA_END=1231 /DNA_ORIENTATION=-